MNLIDAMSTNGTCRRYKTDPVPEDCLARMVGAARWAPSGGNRQPLRFVIVRERAIKEALRDLYLPIWEEYLAQANRGRQQAAVRPRLIDEVDHFARHLADIPVMIVVCARLADVHPTDQALGRLSIVGGASIYPAVQNLLLAARAEGLGTALTTLLCAVEPTVKTLLDIPDEISTAAMVTVGWPERPFPARLSRRPLQEMAFLERYGKPWPAAGDS